MARLTLLVLQVAVLVFLVIGLKFRFRDLDIAGHVVAADHDVLEVGTFRQLEEYGVRIVVGHAVFLVQRVRRKARRRHEPLLEREVDVAAIRGRRLQRGGADRKLQLLAPQPPSLAALEVCLGDALRCQRLAVSGAVETAVLTLELRDVADRIDDLFITDTVAGVVQVALEQLFVDQAVQDLAAYLLALLVTRRCEFRVVRHDFAVACLEVAEADLLAVDLGSISTTQEAVVGTDPDEHEGDGEQREDDEGERAREFFANILKHEWGELFLGKGRDSS
mgnify:CR=1 FL=1